MTKQQLIQEIRTTVNVLNALVKEANEMGLKVQVTQFQVGENVYVTIDKVI